MFGLVLSFDIGSPFLPSKLFWKIPIIISLCVLVLLLSGCGRSRNGTSSDQSEPTTSGGSASSLVSQQDAGQDQFIAAPDQTSTTTNDAVSIASLTTMIERVRSTVVRINTELGSGSGVIVQTQERAGYIITNHHVIEGATWIRVTVNDSAVYDGQLLGVDDVRDLAVVKICCGNFHRARLGNMVGLEPTTEVLILGYPHDIPGPATITQGIVSATRFDVGLQSEVIQTDAAINSGNSGGAMVPLGGEVLGIITFKFTESEGLGFAVSSNVVLRQLPSLWASDPAAPPAPTPVPITTGQPDDDELEESIQAAIERLRPTPTPGTIPAPGATQISAPTPGPAVTPSPPAITPTPHPCSLAEMAHPDELQLVYTRFLAAHPDYQSVSSLGREVYEGLFQEIAGAYILEFIANPTGYTSFRDYLGRGDYWPVAPGGIVADFRTLRSRGLLPDANEPLYQYNQRQASDPCTPARSRLFTDDEAMTLLALGYAKSSVQPFFRQFATNAAIDSIHRFRDRDPTTPLIYWLLEWDDKYGK